MDHAVGPGVVRHVLDCENEGRLPRHVCARPAKLSG